MTERGGTQAQTVREHVGSVSRKTGRPGVHPSKSSEGPIRQNTPKNEGVFLFALDGCRTYREHAIQNISSNKSLWGARVKKRHTTRRCKNASSAVNRDFGCNRGVAEGNGAIYCSAQDYDTSSTTKAEGGHRQK